MPRPVISVNKDLLRCSVSFALVSSFCLSFFVSGEGKLKFEKLNNLFSLREREPLKISAEVAKEHYLAKLFSRFLPETLHSF
jgi:hypothetical protein